MLACSKAGKKIHKDLLVQLLSVDDFLMFKTMMVQRNVQMNMQALQDMKKKGVKTNAIENKVAKHAVNQLQGKVDNEEAEIARALAESKAMFVSNFIGAFNFTGLRRKAEKVILRASGCRASARKGKVREALSDIKRGPA